MLVNTIPLKTLIGKRTPYQHTNVPFVMLWSQKAGCTSVFKWFLWHAGLFDEANEYRKHEEGLSIHNYEIEVFRKVSSYKQALIARLETGVPIINFMRCPYSRAFSSYMHLHNRFYIRFERDGIRHDGLDLRYAILKTVYGYQPPVEYPLSFLDYLEWLDTHSITTIDPHCAQQHTPLYDRFPSIIHYRLEDMHEVISKLEKDFKLTDSTEALSQFSSGHHLNKHPVDQAALMKLFERGIPLSRSPNCTLPDVTREMLVGTQYGDLIERIFHDDIALYDSICPLSK